MTNRAAVFLDRDGVVNKEKGYVHTIDEFQFMDGVFDACRQMTNAGYRLVIITNQAGIGRGYYSEEDYYRLTSWMLNEFRMHDIQIDGVYHCPHHPVHGIGRYRRVCDCRKPAPGMILRAAEELSLDLRRSILVGDKASDIEAGRAAGVGCCILLLTGHAVKKSDMCSADGVFKDMPELGRAIVNNRLCTDCSDSNPSRVN
jgi:D-glycero-D-manno-heptose 1,7-bisphosphate phosphatase